MEDAKVAYSTFKLMYELWPIPNDEEAEFSLTSNLTELLNYNPSLTVRVVTCSHDTNLMT